MAYLQTPHLPSLYSGFKCVAMGSMTPLLLLLLAQVFCSATPLTSPSTPSSTITLTPAQIAEFDENGIILVRQLVRGNELLEAQKTVQKTVESPDFMTKVLRFFFNFTAYRGIAYQNWRTHKSLADISFHSDVPKVVGQLLSRDSKNPVKVRLLKDASFSFGPGDKGCGWHVDDKVFWPCNDEYNGVNVWIALSPSTVDHGGGLAVATGSHKVPWASDAKAVIKYNTCNMETLSPEMHMKLEKLKRTYDMEPGDALIHDRWLFHRSDPVQESRTDSSPLHRYSIRYMPEDALLHDRQQGEAAYRDRNIVKLRSIKKDGSLSELPLKAMGAWYPQVFPEVLAEEIKVAKSFKYEKDFTAAKLLSFLFAMLTKRVKSIIGKLFGVRT